jgi:uncharacterized membrane protein
MARTCEGCGKDMPDSATFCPSCGKESAPAPAAGGGSAPGAAGTGLQKNLAGALAYLWIIAIVFLLLEPYNRDKFVRFHAFQALFHGLAWIGGNIVLSLIPFIGWTLLPFWSLLMFVLAVIAAVKAYQNEEWEIPVVGPFARKQV